MSAPTTPTATSLETSADGLPVGAIVLLGALVFAVLRQGAYHQWQHQVFAVLVVAVGVVILARAPDRSSLASAALIVSPLVVASLVSMAFSNDRGDAGSTFLTLALVGIALAAGQSVLPARRDLATDGVLLVAAIVAVTAIWGVATHTTPWGRITEGVWRGSSSLTYANAAAAVVGPAAVLAFGRAALTGRHVYAVASTLLLVGFISTQSRGGAIALALITIVALAFAGIERTGQVAPSILAGTAVGAVPLLAFAGDPGTPRTVVVLAAVLVGISITFIAMGFQEQMPDPAVSLTVLVVAAIGVVAFTDLAAPLTERFTLRSGTTAGGEDAAVLFGDRAKEWSTAWDLVVDAPLLGHGPGVVDLRWTEDERAFQALFVHNEYLELAVTHGFLGLAALAVSAALLIRQRSRSVALWPATLAIAGYLLHSGVDFLWHVPALPVLFAFLAGLALEPTGPYASTKPTSGRLQTLATRAFGS